MHVYLEEEHLVLLLHGGQEGVLGEIIMASGVLLIRPLALLL